MIAAIVAPCGRLSRPITSACLEAAHDLGWLDFFPSSRFNRLLVACAFVLETCLVLAIFGHLSSVKTANDAVSTEAPRRPNGAGGVEEK